MKSVSVQLLLGLVDILFHLVDQWKGISLSIDFEMFGIQYALGFHDC